MLFGAMKNIIADLNLLPKIGPLNSVSQMDGNPTNQPIELKIKMAPIAPINVRPGRRYQLKPQESLLDVSKTFDINLNTLIELNDINLNAPPPPGTEIRLD